MTKKQAIETRVTVLGAGEIGRAVSHVLTGQGLNHNVWDRDPKKNLCQQPLEETLPKADFLFLCIPSWCLADALKDLAPVLGRKTVVVSVAKGIERGSGRTVDEILRSGLPAGQSFALLAGPMLAEEILQGLKAAAVAASDSPKARRAVVKLFAGSDLRVEPSSDLTGVALAGVLKNAYAICLGVADGLNWGGNRKGWLTARAAQEMAEILRDVGADSRTATSAAGLADLISTGFSEYSSNHESGKNLALGLRGDDRSEGIVALPQLMQRLGRKSRRYPLLAALSEILLGRRNARKTFERYFHEAK